MPPAPRTALAVSLAAALFLAQPAASLVIDNFEEGLFTYTDTSATFGPTFNEESGLANANVRGGVRLVRQQAETTDELVPAVSTAVLVSSASPDDSAVLSVTGLPDTTASFEFIYDGIANLALDSASGNLNLDLSGYDSFDITAVAATVVADVRVTLWSSVAVSQSSITPLVDGITSFALSNFTVNLSDIQSIRVAISGIEPGETVNLSNIAVVVPEPTPGLLVAAGLVALALRRRRAR